MTAPTSESTRSPEDPPLAQPNPVVGVNDWGRVSNAWERVFDDVTEVGSDLKTIFKGAYQAAAVDSSVDLSEAVGSLGAEQFVGVSERLDRGLAGARAALSALGDELHDGGSERLHGEVEGAVKVSLYELGMLMIRMSDKLDGDVPPPRAARLPGPAAAPQRRETPERSRAVTEFFSDVDPAASQVPGPDEAVGGAPDAASPVASERDDSTEEIPELDLTDAPLPADDLVTPVPEPIAVRPASEEVTDPTRVIRPD